MKSLIFAVIVCLFCLSATGCPPQPDPVPRNVSDMYSGSARWAYDLAQPRFSELLPADAVFFYIIGSMVGQDGRIAANTGAWTFRFWSATQNKSVGVQVNYDARVVRSVLTTDSDPTDNRSPIPDGWLNSTDIYEIACPTCGASGFGGAALNSADPSYGDGQPVWMLLNLNNTLIRWDGVPVAGP